MIKSERILELENEILRNEDASNAVYDEYVALLEAAYEIEEYMYHEQPSVVCKRRIG